MQKLSWVVWGPKQVSETSARLRSNTGLQDSRTWKGSRTHDLERVGRVRIPVCEWRIARGRAHIADSPLLASALRVCPFHNHALRFCAGVENYELAEQPAAYLHKMSLKLILKAEFGETGFPLFQLCLNMIRCVKRYDTTKVWRHYIYGCSKVDTSMSMSTWCLCPILQSLVNDPLLIDKCFNILPNY